MVDNHTKDELPERLTVYISEEIHRALRAYVDKRYGGRHGSLSWVVEDAIKQYLDKSDEKGIPK